MKKFLLIVCGLIFIGLSTQAQLSLRYTVQDEDVVVENGYIKSFRFSSVHASNNIKIPTILDGQTVIGISGPQDRQMIGVFQGKNLTGVSFPTTLESIGINAFKGNSIDDIDLNELVVLRSIGANAFSGNNFSGYKLPKNEAANFAYWEGNDGNIVNVCPLCLSMVYNLQTSYYARFNYTASFLVKAGTGMMGMLQPKSGVYIDILDGNTDELIESLITDSHGEADIALIEGEDYKYSIDEYGYESVLEEFVSDVDVLMTINLEYQQAFSGDIVIYGTYRYDETLIAGLSNSNHFGTLIYQWQRDGVDISNATQSNYTLTVDDIGTKIRVKITSTDRSGWINSSETSTIDKASWFGPILSYPTLVSKTHNSVSFEELSGNEYAIDGGAWQSSATFTGLTPETIYSFTRRICETSTHTASSESASIAIMTNAEPSNALIGTVSISGTLKYGQLLEAMVSGSNNTGTISYQWKRDGGIITGATDKVYTLAASDIATVITVEVSSSNETGSIVSAQSALVEKADQMAPVQATLANKTHNSITLNVVSGCEYAVSGGSWQSSTTFNNLSPETLYRFIQRYKATSTHHASSASASLGVETSAEPSNALIGTVSISGTLKYGQLLEAMVSGSNNTGTISYQWKRDGGVITGATDKVYTLAASDIATVITVEVSSSNETGSIESAQSALVEKADQMAPVQATLANKTHNSITLNVVSGCEYAVSGGSWQSSTTFNNLSPETLYRFIQRYKATSTHHASSASASLGVETSAEPSNALIGTVSISGTLKYGQLLEAMVSGSNNTGTISYQWKRDGAEIAGANAETYTLVEADIATSILVEVKSSNETGSISSQSTSIIEKADQVVPKIPVLIERTSTTITLEIVPGCEYCVNDGTWQSSSTFSGLTPDTEYHFKQCFMETTTHKASAESIEVVFSTVAIVLSSENLLSNIAIDGLDLEGFSGDILDYIVHVDVGSSPIVSATGVHAMATIAITQVSVVPGEAHIVVTAEDGSVRTYILRFELSTDVGSFDIQTIQCYPNPVVDQLVVDFNGVSDQYTIQLISLTGELCWQKHIEGEKRIVVPMAELNDGVYFVKMRNRVGDLYVEKIMKRK